MEALSRRVPAAARVLDDELKFAGHAGCPGRSELKHELAGCFGPIAVARFVHRDPTGD